MFVCPALRVVDWLPSAEIPVGLHFIEVLTQGLSMSLRIGRRGVYNVCQPTCVIIIIIIITRILYSTR